MKQSLKHTYSSLINSHITTTVFVLVFAVLGTIIILSVHAASISTTITASSGTLSGNISSCSNSSSINGKVIWFGSKNCSSNTATKTSTTSTSKTASGGSGSSSSRSSGAGSGSTATTSPSGGSNMFVGVNLNGIGSNPGPDMAGAVKYVRADLKSWGIPASTFTSSGIKVDDLFAGTL